MLQSVDNSFVLKKTKAKSSSLYSDKSALHLYVDVISTLSSCIYILIMRLDRYDRFPCTAMDIVFLHSKSQEPLQTHTEALALYVFVSM